MLPWVGALAGADFFLGAVEGLAFFARSFLSLERRSGIMLEEECPAIVTGSECRVRSVDIPLGLGKSNGGQGELRSLARTSPGLGVDREGGR